MARKDSAAAAAAVAAVAAAAALVAVPDWRRWPPHPELGPNLRPRILVAGIFFYHHLISARNVSSLQYRASFIGHSHFLKELFNFAAKIRSFSLNVRHDIFPKSRLQAAHLFICVPKSDTSLKSSLKL